MPSCPPIVTRLGCVRCHASRRPVCRVPVVAAGGYPASAAPCAGPRWWLPALPRLCRRVPGSGVTPPLPPCVPGSGGGCRRYPASAAVCAGFRRWLPALPRLCRRVCPINGQLRAGRRVGLPRPVPCRPRPPTHTVLCHTRYRAATHCRPGGSTSIADGTRGKEHFSEVSLGQILIMH